jgi:hypothetical protein
MFAVTAACTGTSPTTPTLTERASIGLSASTDGDNVNVAGAVQPLRGPKQQKITKGTMTTAASTMTGMMTLSGPRFEVAGDWLDGGSTGCQPCRSGATSIWTSASFTGSPASASVDGVRYERVYLTGNIKVSGTVNTPPADSPAFAVGFPFAVDDSSLLIGYDSNPLIGPATELFRLDLKGTGTATLELTTVTVPEGSRIYTARSIVYAF